MKNPETAPSATGRPQLWVEALMAALALVTIWLSFEPDFANHHLVSWSIWGVFVAEYGVRLIAAPRRWDFVRSNPADLIAIMPFDLLRAFRLIRLLRVLQLIRGLTVLRRVGVHASGILRTNGLAYVLFGSFMMVMTSGLLIATLEPGIKNTSDGLWWSIVTASTIGYGDMAPKTPEGRLVAVVLILVGIGMIAMVTSSIATYFIGSHGTHNPHVRHLQKQLDGWESMSPEERREIAAVLRTLADRAEH